VAAVAEQKLRREGALTLELEPTDDIVRSVVEHRQPGTLVVAFAAEIGLDVGSAREKLRRKGVDAIVLNDVSQMGLGFDSDRNAAVFLAKDCSVDIAEASKGDIAQRVLDEIVALQSRSLSRMGSGT
jgi:phosphopantothenoylcysteine decarboxylase/phosphopantothenate--cysteine ligase